MDSKLCVWDARGTRAKDLIGHAGSVSALAVNADTAVSAGYDKTLRIWSIAPSVGARDGGDRGVLTGHKAPVLTLAWGSEGSATDRSTGSTGGGLASGDRDGVVMLWDAGAGRAVGRRAGHKGHCTALAWVCDEEGAPPRLLLSGGQDGVVKAWDPRAAGTAAVAETAAHAEMRKKGAGVGAVGDIVQTSGGRVVTAGADGHVAVLDPRKGLGRIARLPCGDFGGDGGPPRNVRNRLDSRLKPSSETVSDARRRA